MPFINFNTSDDQNGKFYRVEREGGSKALMFVPTALTNSKHFADQIAPFVASTAFIVAHIPTLVEGLSPSGFKKTVPEQIKPISRNFVSLQNKTITRKEELSAQEQEWLKPPKPIDPGRGAEIRSYLRSQRLPDIMHLALNNPDVAAVVLDFPLLSGLSADLIDRIKPLVIENNLMNRYATQNEKKPSFGDILANGPDYDVARGYAREAIKLHEQSRTEIDEVHTLLKSSIDFIAVIGDVTRSESYGILAAA
jgi:hypothetical protein